MKPAGFLLLLFVGGASAGRAAEPGTGIVSRDIAGKIREGLPSYQRPASNPGGASAVNESAQPAEPGVLVLPKMTVEEKRLPRDADDHLMNRDDFKRKMENVYLDELEKDGPLNYFLNRFTIPVLSPSKAERGKAIHRQRELDRLRQVTEIDGSRASRKQLERELDNSHTTRPAGGLQRK